MPQQVTILLIGMVTGFFSGMFGIGGSVIATPLLITFTGIDSRFAVSSPLAAVIFSAISGTISYYSKRIFDKKLILFTLLSAVPFGFLGSFLNKIVDVDIIIILKAALLFALSFRFFTGNKIDTSLENEPKNITILLIGAIGGLISGFVAIGGGIVFVSGFTFLLKKDMTTASANSLICVGIVSLLNSIVHFQNEFIDLNTALWLVIGIVPMAFLGAKLNIKLKNRTLELLFGILMLIFSGYFIIDKVF